MFPVIFVLFLTVPIIEIFILIQVGSALGAWTTLLIVILTAVLGTFMLREQSLSTLRSVQTKLNAGEVPATQMFEGVALLIGGVLLLTPGFVTDAIGFFCLVPFTRRWAVSRLLKNANVSVFQGEGHKQSVYQESPKPQSNPHKPTVIDGEFKREDRS